MTDHSIDIVLASTSVYRRELLEKLALPFSQIDPEFEEVKDRDEDPGNAALRLARGKARSAHDKHPPEGPRLIIGSDQVAACEGKIQSKPGTYAKATAQLHQCSGQWVSYTTAVCLINESGDVVTEFCDKYELKFRQLNQALIERYLALDEPFDCAGSIKAESHGILLIEESRGLDINTLYGLPLIRLTSAFYELGILK